MRTLICNTDLRTLYSGVAVACVAGLLMGAAMHPNLRGEDDAAGPQLQTPSGGVRAQFTSGEAGVGGYGDVVPAYVVGTDWVRSTQAASAQSASYEAARDPGGDVMAYETAEDVSVHAAPAGWREPERTAAAYPSEHGGGYYESDLPAAPEPPGEGDEESAPA